MGKRFYSYQKCCATCEYWSGSREALWDGNRVKGVEAYSTGRCCNHNAGTRGKTTGPDQICAGGPCMRPGYNYEKWYELD